MGDSELDDFDLDLDLGFDEPPKGSEEGQEAPRSPGKDNLPVMSSYGQAEHVMRPLTASQLAQVFRTDRKTVQAKLRGCPPAAKNTRGSFLYDIATASKFLVEPHIDIESYIKRLKPSDLPPRLHDAYWSALEKRQKVEQRAGELWETDQVIEVFGELAKEIKSAVTLWVDQLEKTQRLDDEQRDFFTDQCDRLLSMIFESFNTLKEKRKSGSLLQKYRDQDV